MKRKLFLFFLILLPYVSFGQCWLDIFGNSQQINIGAAVAETSDSGFITVGTGMHNIIRTDKKGVVQWVKSFPKQNGYEVSVQAVIPTKEKGYTFAGIRYFKFNLFHTDSIGNVTWNVVFDTTVGYGSWHNLFLLNTRDKGYLLCSTIEVYNTVTNTFAYNNALLIKTDSTGALQWQLICDSTLATSVTETYDNDYLVTLLSDSSNYRNTVLKKIDNQGTIKWTRKLPQSNGSLYSVVAVQNRGYLAAGNNWYNEIIYMTKLDTSGNVVWCRNIIPDVYATGHQVIRKISANKYAVASGFSNNTECICYIMITDSLANIVCVKKINLRTQNIPTDIIVSRDGGLIVTGITNLTPIQPYEMDWFLLKADTLCSCEFSDTSNYNTDPPHIKPEEEPKPVLLIPNIFSPNGDDQNDLFFIRGPEIESVDLSIYNRWGNKVFETKDKAFGWDGKQNGMECEVGIYAYMVAITFSNGQSLIKKGNVSLVR